MNKLNLKKISSKNRLDDVGMHPYTYIRSFRPLYREEIRCLIFIYRNISSKSLNIKPRERKFIKSMVADMLVGGRNKCKFSIFQRQWMWDIFCRNIKECSITYATRKIGCGVIANAKEAR